MNEKKNAVGTGPPFRDRKSLKTKQTQVKPNANQGGIQDLRLVVAQMDWKWKWIGNFESGGGGGGGVVVYIYFRYIYDYYSIYSSNLKYL